ncbi:MAG: glycosyl hydrolase family 28-related protein, partial [Planctomycetota bacterium]
MSCETRFRPWSRVSRTAFTATALMIASVVTAQPAAAVEPSETAVRPEVRAALAEVGGYLDVTAPEFGADPTGKTDSTAAIQAAIDAAREQIRDGLQNRRVRRGSGNAKGQEDPGTSNATVYFPAGTYLVSDTLTLGKDPADAQRF